MAGIKQRGIISVQSKRYWKGEEVKPCRYYSDAERVRGIMCGTVNGEIIRDKDGKVIPYKSIQPPAKTLEDPVATEVQPVTGSPTLPQPFPFTNTVVEPVVIGAA